MSNEELAARIKNGERDLIPELWEQERRLIAFFMRRWLAVSDAYRRTTFEDCMQSGFLALLDAVNKHDSAKGALNTILPYYLRRAFRSELHITTKKHSMDPLYTACSLHHSVVDEDGAQVADMIADTEAAAAFERRELRISLDRALDLLPPMQRNAIKRKYYHGDDRVSNTAVTAGLRRLRQLPMVAELSVYL